MVYSDGEQGDSEAASNEYVGGKRFTQELVRELEGITPSFLDSAERFPSGLELRLAPAQFRAILGIAQALVEVDWSRLPTDLAANVQGALTRLMDVVRAILRFPEGAEEDPIAGAQNLRDDMERLANFFSKTVEPAVERARRDGTPADSEREAAAQAVEAAQIREALTTAQAELAELRAQNSEISAELEARGALVEARRDETSASGATELAKAYSDQARQHAKQGWYWGGALIGALILAVGAGLLLLLKVNELPTDATAGEIASHITLDILIVGLLIYVVRMASHQFSVHRHLAAIADSKAAALQTFSRIVSSASEPETRTAIAEILAQSVFSSDHSGFIASSNDQITLVERLAGTVSQRAASNR